MSPSKVTTAARLILHNPELFSKHVLTMDLYPYQLDPLKTIVASILARQGREFLLVFPRQSGKNEAVAHLLVYLMNLLQRTGGNIVYGAEGDGLGRGIRRLEDRLENDWNHGRWRKGSRPTKRTLNKSEVIFLSTNPRAQARGETAHWLLVIDELQDCSAAHVEAVFQPMRAANNATALYIGTVKTTSDALWLKKRELEEKQTRDGNQYVYIVHPDQVTASNPYYADFLHAKIEKLGRNHPIVASEYFNEPIGGSGGLFGEQRIQLMRGKHSRQAEPEPGSTYVATLDVAGIDEATTDPIAQLDKPARDYTVATIFEIEDGDDQPTFLARDVFTDQGGRHFQSTPGSTSLAARLLAWLQHWQVRHLVGDASGVGAGLVDWLQARRPTDTVTSFLTTATTKAQLGSDFLALIETGRVKFWKDDEQPLSDSWWFFTQAAACTYTVPPDQPYEKALSWFVPASAKVDTPAGPLPIHDDRLLSAALITVVDELILEGKITTGQAISAIVPPQDPLADLEF
jgi:hypothetical protein